MIIIYVLRPDFKVKLSWFHTKIKILDTLIAKKFIIQMIYPPILCFDPVLGGSGKRTNQIRLAFIQISILRTPGKRKNILTN